VFFTVATRLSFTKAATEVITQPAVSKHIKIRRAIQSQTFNRKFENFPDSSWRTISKTCQEYFEIYREIDFEMSALIKEQYGLLRLGASTTISQYLIPIISSFPSRDERYQSHFTKWKYRTN
jgi:DNA-binding transcriptional LysR family regulator